MAHYYLKTTWRSLWKDRRFAALNLVGLSVALTCVLFIYLWAADETGVDKFHTNRDRLYQVMAHIKLPDGIHTQENTPYLLSRALAGEMPEVEQAAAFQEGAVKGALSVGEKHIIARRYFADKDFLNLFSFRLIEGNKNNALDDKYSVLLSDKMAKKLFNTTENLIGKTIQWQNGLQPFKISGIFEEPASNSSLQFDVLFTYELFYQVDTANANNWSNSSPFTFLLLKEGTDARHFGNKLTGFLHTKYKNSPLTLSLRKYTDRYLYDKYENGVQSGGRIRYVRLFSIIAAFILLIACINFMNLSTAKTARRLKQAGIKKILGAERGPLIFQYISESLLMAFTALLMALLFGVLLLPQFNSITGKQLTLHFSGASILALTGIGVLTGLIAGSYPAFYLSAFKPATALKGKFGTVLGELWMRKGLVVFQYTLSVIFITAVIVIYKQMDLIRTIDLGYKKDNVLSFKNDKKINENFTPFMTDVRNIPGVVAASGFNGDLYGNASGSTERVDWEGKLPGTQILFTNLDMDYGLIELLGIKIKEGRSFSKSFGSDSSAIILNEAAIAAMGSKTRSGKPSKCGVANTI